MAQLKDLLVNGDTRVAGKLLVDERSGGHFLTPIHFNSESLPSKTLQYVIGIDGFAEGGQAGWQSKAAFLSDVTTDITNVKNNYVKKAGDTMTGFLTLHANPTANLHAATKQYVDATVENAAKLFTTTTTITTDTASSVVFDTSTVTLSTCLIYYNGLLMTPGVNYSITNNTTIALSGWTANKGDIFTVSGKQADETSVIAAGKLTCGTVGSSTKPVYFENGIPVECSKSIGEGYLPLSGGTITGTSGDTPLYLKSASTATWLGFKNSSGTNLGFFGFSGTNIPSVYLDKTYKLLHDGNYNSYSPTLTGGGASGTWNISISGNAVTATSATKATQDGNGATITSTYVPFTSYHAAGVDFNKIINSGFHRVANGNLNNPGSDWGQLLVMHGGGDTITQIYGAYGDGTLKTRSGNPADVGGTGSWTEWKTLLDSSNYTSYTVTKSGTGATGTWGISISGSAATLSATLPVNKGGTGATTAANARANLGITVEWLNSIHNHVGANINPSAIEFSNASGHGGYIDFHFNNSTADNTSRIIEDASGQLTAIANFRVRNDTNYTTAKCRNIYANTTTMTAGSSSLANGTIYLQYK